jgi:hypothetical protein
MCACISKIFSEGIPYLNWYQGNLHLFLLFIQQIILFQVVKNARIQQRRSVTLVSVIIIRIIIYTIVAF